MSESGAVSTLIVNLAKKYDVNFRTKACMTSSSSREQRSASTFLIHAHVRCLGVPVRFLARTLQSSSTRPVIENYCRNRNIGHPSGHRHRHDSWFAQEHS